MTGDASTTTAAAVAVLVDTREGPDWLSALAPALRKRAELRVYTLDEAPAHTSPRPGLARLYTRLDRRLHRVHPAARASVERVETIRARESDLMQVLDGVEVVIDLRARPDSMVVPAGTPVVTVGQEALDDVALLGQLLARRPTVRAVVTVEQGGSSRVGAESLVAARPLSLSRSRARLGRRYAALVDRVVAGLLTGEPTPTVHLPSGVLSTQRVSNSGVVRLLGAGVAAALRRSLLTTHWRVVWGERADGAGPFSVPEELHVLRAPTGRFLADPMLASDGSRTYLFVEDFDLSVGRASIAVVDLDDPARPLRTVLTADHHLSYPFVFRYGSSWYLMPESAGAARIVLYRATSFPYEWVEDTVLLEGRVAFDPTFIEHGGRWWLFFSSGASGGPIDDELYVYSGESPLGPLVAHPRNPVRSGALGSRPAGRIVRSNDRLYRPGQIAEREYGGGIAVHEITELTEDAYAEREVNRIDRVTGRSVRGVHTIDSNDSLIVLDTKHRVIDWRRMRRSAGRPAASR